MVVPARPRTPRGSQADDCGQERPSAEQVPPDLDLDRLGIDIGDPELSDDPGNGTTAHSPDSRVTLPW